MDLGPNWDVWVALAMSLLDGFLAGEIERKISHSSVKSVKVPWSGKQLVLDFSLSANKPAKSI